MLKTESAIFNEYFVYRVRVLQQRKVRAEQAERQQALALERMQRLVDDTPSGPPHAHAHAHALLNTSEEGHLSNTNHMFFGYYIFGFKVRYIRLVLTDQ